MEDRIRLSYFYGKEADQFSFYKIPKLLFTEEYFKKISVEAKVLYGLMLDRMSLSMKNQWMDDEGRAYIYYSLEDIMEALGCSNKKAISIMKELDTDVFNVNPSHKKPSSYWSHPITILSTIFLE